MAHPARPMVGRDGELSELAAALGVRPASEPVTAGRHVLLSGDAGVGKTRLLVALRDRAVESGWLVVAGHCLDFGDSALPYLPFSEVLGRLEAELPDVVQRVAAAHPALARLQPGRRVLGPGEPAPRAEGESLDRGDLFAAVHELLEAAAAVQPVLLVVEDCHWADQSTRDLLSFLFSRPFEGPVAVVASYRSDDLHRRHPLRRQVAEWSRLGGVERLQLAPLREADVRLLIASLGAGALGEDDLAAILRRADGNAFFVEELVGAAAATPGAWTPDELHHDLADLLLVRLDRLDDTARHVVRVASVAGRKVGHDLLVAASGLGDGALEDGLRQAVEMNLLVPGDGTYSFRHALLGEAVYDDLLPGERVRMHARYADALGKGGRGTAAELARHARLALDLDLALDASVRAGDEAMAVAGAGEAARHYEQALELLADPTRRAATDLDLSKLAVAAADALTLSGQPTRAVALLGEQLASLPADAPPAWRARMLAVRADALYITDGTESPLDLITEAVAALPEESAGGLRATVLATYARILSGYRHFDEAQAAGLDALALAERLDLHDLANDVMITLSQLKKSGPKEGLREALVEAVDRAVEGNALHAELRARFFLGRSYQDWAQWPEAERWFRSAIGAGAAAGLPYAPYAFESRWQLAWIKTVDGDWDEAIRLTDTVGEPIPPIPAALVASVALLVRTGRGEAAGDEARALRRFWDVEGGIAINSAVAELAAAAGPDPQAVLQVYREVVGTLGRIWHEWFSARIRLAAVTIGVIADAVPTLPAADRPRWVAEVERLHEDGHTVLSQYADPSGHWGPEGRAWVKRLDAETLRARWLAGVDAPPQDVLVEAWRETETLFDDFGHVHETAVVRAVLAGILRASGDPAAARDLADRSREVAHRLGAVPLLARLRASGSAPQPRSEATPDALTPRETEILALVAEGRTNGEIAKQLFISTKTVSVHVSHILAKLGAAGRTEAAAIARRRGLLD